MVVDKNTHLIQIRAQLGSNLIFLRIFYHKIAPLGLFLPQIRRFQDKLGLFRPNLSRFSPFLVEIEIFLSTSNRQKYPKFSPFGLNLGQIMRFQAYFRPKWPKI